MEHGTWNMEHGTWNMEHGTMPLSSHPEGVITTEGSLFSFLFISLFSLLVFHFSKQFYLNFSLFTFSFLF
jgi:hypothetical protein